jgi:hypothetical protein
VIPTNLIATIETIKTEYYNPTFYCPLFRVEIPNGKYKGQKLIKLVRMKIPARTNRIMAKVPEMMFA